MNQSKAGRIQVYFPQRGISRPILKELQVHLDVVARIACITVAKPSSFKRNIPATNTRAALFRIPDEYHRVNIKPGHAGIISRNDLPVCEIPVL